MKIDVSLKLDEESILQKGSKVASGWVTANDIIKFPVTVRRFTDKESEKEKMFVSYPQQKKGGSYDSILYPSDRELKREIDEKVLEDVWNTMEHRYQGLDSDDVEIRISLLDPKFPDDEIKNVGIASVDIMGFTINRILVKEGRYGLFVQMPQYRSGNEYRDMVYATSRSVQADLRRYIIEAYEEKLKKVNDIQNKLEGMEYYNRSANKPVNVMEALKEDERQLAQAQRQAAEAGAAGLEYLDILGSHSYFDWDGMKFHKKIFPAYMEDKNAIVYRAEFQDPTEWTHLEKEAEPAAEKALEKEEPDVEPPRREILEPETPPDLDGAERFMKAYEQKDKEGMLQALTKVDLEITETGYTEDGSLISYASAIFYSGEKRVEIVFGNEYEPERTSAKPVRQEIFAFIPQADGNTDICTLMERKSSNAAEARQGYDEVMARWQRITGKEGQRKQMKNIMTGHLPDRPNAVFTQPRR